MTAIFLLPYVHSAPTLTPYGFRLTKDVSILSQHHVHRQESNMYTYIFLLNDAHINLTLYVYLLYIILELVSVNTYKKYSNYNRQTIIGSSWSLENNQLTNRVICHTMRTSSYEKVHHTGACITPGAALRFTNYSGFYNLGITWPRPPWGINWCNIPPPRTLNTLTQHDRFQFVEIYAIITHICFPLTTQETHCSPPNLYRRR